MSGMDLASRFAKEPRSRINIDRIVLLKTCHDIEEFLPAFLTAPKVARWRAKYKLAFFATRSANELYHLRFPSS
jgi:hypothetical protein